MLLLAAVLLLASILDQSLGQEDLEDSGVEDSGSHVSPELQVEIINKHNEIRRNVKPSAANMLKMVWSEAIGERARKWAEKCNLQISPKEERTTNDTFCGEIVFEANYIVTWPEVIDHWNEKKSNFKYGVGAIDQKVNIYPHTQLIWYNSYRVGCAATYCPDNSSPYFYVCQYCPAGNIQEQIAQPYKRGRSCGDCRNDCERKLCTNPCKYSDAARNCMQMKRLFSCKNTMVKKNCRATCFCRKEIA